MPSVGGYGLGRALRLLLVVPPAAVTTVVAHAVVTGALPGVGAVLVAGVLAVALVANVLARAGALAAMLGAQLVFHGAFALTQPAGCLHAVGRAATAGVDLARLSVASACEPALFLQSGSAEQVALLAVVSVLPLGAAHALAALASAAGAARVEDAVRSVLALVGTVLVRLPQLVRVPVVRPLPPVVASGRVAQSVLVPVRPLVRRGPPVVAAA